MTSRNRIVNVKKGERGFMNLPFKEEKKLFGIGGWLIVYVCFMCWMIVQTLIGSYYSIMLSDSLSLTFNLIELGMILICLGLLIFTNRKIAVSVNGVYWFLRGGLMISLGSFAGILWPIVWMLYLYRSKRVENTFVK